MTRTQVLSKREQPREERRGPGRLAPHVGLLHRTRILYVDDERLLRNATNRLLQGAGAACLLAGTHDQAVMLATSEPALTLAIIDFHMPDGPIDGLLKRLRVANRALPLIGTSGEDRRSAFRDRGVAWFLAKPWRLADLVHAVAQMTTSNLLTAASPGSPDAPTSHGLSV